MLKPRVCVPAAPHVFVVAMEAIRTVRKPLVPNPAVHLPITPPEMLRRPDRVANENTPAHREAD